MRRSPLLALLTLLLGAEVATAGTLEIATQPGVDIYWEGVHLATTDTEGVLVVEDIPAGPFELTLSKRGFEELTTEVTIAEGTTRLERQLQSLGEAAPTPQPEQTPRLEPIGESSQTSIRASESEQSQVSTGPAAEAPKVRFTPGAWLAALVVLGVAGFLALRSRRPAEVSAPPPQARATPKPKVTRERPEVKTGGGFLHELRQRERALDELVDVSPAEGRRAESHDRDVVDVAWKEID